MNGTSLSYEETQQSDSLTINHIPLHIGQKEKSLVLLQFGTLWASGILLSNDGYIITTAHLLRTTNNNNIDVSYLAVTARIYCNIENTKLGFKWMPCDVKYVCNSSYMDVAILKLRNFDPKLHLEPIEVEDKIDPMEGEEAFVFGYPLFLPHHIEATCTRGIISKIIRNDSGRPIILQTTAAVYRGSSGRLMQNKKGKQKGMVTTNLRVKQQDKIIGKINYSIPMEQIQPLLNYIQNGEDISTLNFDSLDNSMAKLFKLNRSPPTNKSKSIQDKKINDFIQQVEEIFPVPSKL